jgi:hypothetical protein
MRVSHIEDLMVSGSRSRRDSGRAVGASTSKRKTTDTTTAATTAGDRERDLDELDTFEENIIRGSSGAVEEERTPRARTVKQLNSGSLDTSPVRETSGLRRLSGGESTQEQPSKRHVKFEEPGEVSPVGEKDKKTGALGFVEEEEEDDDDVVLVGHEGESDEGAAPRYLLGSRALATF